MNPKQQHQPQKLHIEQAQNVLSLQMLLLELIPNYINILESYREAKQQKKLS